MYAIRKEIILLLVLNIQQIGISDKNHFRIVWISLVGMNINPFQAVKILKICLFMSHKSRRFVKLFEKEYVCFLKLQ